MAPKDIANNFYLIEMNNERENDDEIDLTTIRRISSIDSLEQSEILMDTLRSITGVHKWNNSNEKIRVENSLNHPEILAENNLLINRKTSIEIKEEDDEIVSSSETDFSLQHFDVQLQVNHGQLQPVIRYGVFTSIIPKQYPTFKQDQSTQTMEPEMDMEYGNERRNRNSNGYSQQNNNNNNNGGGYQRNRQANGSGSGGGSGDGDEDGSNPNRNNPRRSDDDDDDDENDDESDENLAHRLGFRSIDSATLRVVHRLRSLTNRQSFDRRDFENVQYLIDELIRLQHLENYSEEQLENLIDLLKLHRILRNKSHALIFIQERLPKRNNRSSQDNNSNVFDLWRERERRARLDSKDSLEDEGQNNNNGQQNREPVEIIPTIISSGNHSKVKQMARHIDTKSSSARAGEYHRSRSPSPPLPPPPTQQPLSSINNRGSDGLRSEIHIKRNHSPTTSSEQHRVRQMVDRLESSSSNTKATKDFTTKKSYQDDYVDDTNQYTSSPSISRITRQEHHEQRISNGNNINNNNNNGGSFVFRPRSPPDEVFVRDNQARIKRFELDREEIRNGGRRTTSGTTIDDYVTSLLPNTETSISMVREIRARLYEDESAFSQIDVDNTPVKVDVETLYILEQKTDKKSLQQSPVKDIHTSDYDYNRSSNKERHDFAMQTTVPTSNGNVSNRPVGTQVETTIKQNTVAAQTTDSLHRPIKERQRLFSDASDEEEETSKIIRSTTTTTVSKIIRRRSSHHTSEDEDDDKGGSIVINLDDEDNFQLTRRLSTDEVSEQRSTFDQVTSRLHIDQLRDLNRDIVRRRVEQIKYDQDETRSNEVYEIHTRGACKCLVVSYEENTQYGSETRFEKQLKRIERTYTDEELKTTELHVIVTSSDSSYRLVRRDYGANRSIDDDLDDKLRQSSVTIHYYTKEGHRIATEQARLLEHLPLFIRCEIEYELNHYRSAQLIILSVTNAERCQMNVSTKKDIVDETISHSSGRFAPNSPELEQEINRRLADQISLLRLVDYSSRDDYNQTNSTDLRRVARTDVSTSLRIVQRYRTVIHRLCQQYRSHLRLTTQAEQQRHLILVALNEYYLFDLASSLASLPANKSDIQQRQHHIFKREVQNLPVQPFDYAKYRRETAQQQRILEQHYPQTKTQQSEPEFYLGANRRALIEREIHSMRESIRPHEHAPPRYKHEPKRRSLSISYSGAQRYVRARIIHVKDYYAENCQHQQIQQQQQQQPLPNAKEQELFVRVDDYINESAANSLRRSYSTDYLQEDGPRSRIRYIRIPGETIRIEEKTTYEYQGVMYANLPYSLRYWNILQILDREAREGRPLGSSLPHIIVNDPYQTVIPPLTQQEIRQTAQQVLSSQYQPRSYTDQTLRWFLSRDNRTEIESGKYLQTLQQCRQQQQQQHYQQQHQQHYQQQHQQKQMNVRVQQGGRQGVADKYYVTETLVRYEKMPDRLVPLSVHERAQSIDNLHHRSPSANRTVQQTFHSQTNLNRSQSQPRPQNFSNLSTFTPNSRANFPVTNAPLSRHQSVHELRAKSTLSHPPSPSPSLHSLHSNYHSQQQQNRRPVSFNNHFPTRYPRPQGQNPLYTEIYDSQTGRRIVTTSQEQLPTEVLGLLNRYNLQQF